MDQGCFSLEKVPGQSETISSSSKKSLMDGFYHPLFMSVGMQRPSTTCLGFMDLS